MEIETERLLLRMQTPEDAGALLRILSDAEFRTYLPVQQPPTLEQVEAGLGRILAHWEERGYGHWILSPKNSREVLGYCGLRFLAETEEVEIFYGIDRPHWGRGLVTEAAKATLRFGFEEAKLERVIALAHPSNKGTRRVMEKAGLRYEKQAVYFDMECAYYALDREQYRADGSLYILRS
ncbi:MAG TPA: GNAT family N-acetyltransferase [Pyrinomonadaceae bacterium]|jgi:ribosomal-protein-alanine N-acetyltransferase|nr:GNAT family N-acetyltransferase [Pyrinomonadaceae bacterium]